MITSDGRCGICFAHIDNSAGICFNCLQRPAELPRLPSTPCTECSEKDREITRLREALEPFLDHDCENPARCRMMRSLNQGAVLCRICEAQAALAAGRKV